MLLRDKYHLPGLKVYICLEINSLAITTIKTQQKEPKNQQLRYWKLYRYMHFFKKEHQNLIREEKNVLTSDKNSDRLTISLT